MLAIVAVCVLVALVAIVGYLSFHIAWMGGLFALAAIAGFAAQIWLVIDFARSKPPSPGRDFTTKGTKDTKVERGARRCCGESAGDV